MYFKTVDYSNSLFPRSEENTWGFILQV